MYIFFFQSLDGSSLPCDQMKIDSNEMFDSEFMYRNKFNYDGQPLSIDDLRLTADELQMNGGSRLPNEETNESNDFIVQPNENKLFLNGQLNLVSFTIDLIQIFI